MQKARRDRQNFNTKDLQDNEGKRTRLKNLSFVYALRPSRLSFFSVFIRVIRVFRVRMEFPQ